MFGTVLGEDVLLAASRLDTGRYPPTGQGMQEQEKPTRRTWLSAILRRMLLRGPHTCPWWFGYSFDNPARRLFHDPDAIFDGLVESGQTVVDLGCGLGYFTLALARLVGPTGKVIALDIQPRMIEGARRRAQRQGLAERIDFRVCAPDHLGVTAPVDFVLAFWMLHEVADPERLLAEVRCFLKPAGRLLIVEPKGHVSAAAFAATTQLARSGGWHVSDGPPIRFSRSILCKLNETITKAR